MGTNQASSRFDTLEIKSLMYRQIGTQRADTYFHNLTRFLTSKITKSELDKLCLKTIGKQNIPLHNRLIRSIIKNATLSKSPPLKYPKKKGGNFVRLSNGNQRKFRDRASPLGKQTQSVVTTTTSGATELLVSLGSRPPLDVEEGEEVEQVAAVTAPFGVDVNLRKSVSCTSFSFNSESCLRSGELPDTRTLRRRLEMRLEREGVKVSMDSVSVLNCGLDVFMRRLIEPCLSLANARCGGNGLVGEMSLQKAEQRRRVSSCVSMYDFRVGMELNPEVLGGEWPLLLEKICSHGLDE
ncbi:unnamed protein product [Eruca vesicaria subsp. sativa]|uniref:Transcriptional regulator of RNA polII, SAGA, subunit n=1 Tax=Eruca vesicaria subsp. sativa TaxID=29727 RepID=A0ABC8JS10_ERUVS|nr:unnamed protein product [Eruca vesicaria subsp. sativa]